LILNWKSHREFANFVREFSSNNEQYTVDSLANHFFDRFEDRHKKHFNQWCHKYLYLVLGGESISTSYIDSRILGRELLSGSYVSTKHKATIYVAAMGDFLTSRSTPIDLRSKHFFELHQDDTGKDNHFASLIDIFRSATVLDYKHMKKQAAKNGILHGNQHLAAGNIGTWVDKAEQREASKDIVNTRGGHYTTLIILQIIARNKRVESIPRSKEHMCKIRKPLTSWSDQLRAVRTGKTVKIYACVVFTIAPRPLNSIKKKRGFDITNHMKGEVPYSLLRILHIIFIREEIIFRGCTLENSWSVRALSQALKQHSLLAQKQYIQEKTGCKNPKSSKLNEKILPIHCAADEYYKAAK